MPRKQDPFSADLDKLAKRAFAAENFDLEMLVNGALEMERKVRDESAFTRIMQEIQARHPSDSYAYDKIIGDDALPIGHRRMLAVYFGSADIHNGGFLQYFWNGFGCLSMPAIEAYAKAGQVKMVKVMKEALKIALSPDRENKGFSEENLASYRQVVSETNFRLPVGFLDKVDITSKSFDKLNKEFYALTLKLPGAADLPSAYPDGFITWYFKQFPREFVFPEE